MVVVVGAEVVVAGAEVVTGRVVEVIAPVVAGAVVGVGKGLPSSSEHATARSSRLAIRERRRGGAMPPAYGTGAHRAITVGSGH